MIRFFCNGCGVEIPDEMHSYNVVISIPKSEHQRTSRGNLCLQCTRNTCNNLGLPVPVALDGHGIDRGNLKPSQNERDVKLAAKASKGMQPARTWVPGSNK